MRIQYRPVFNLVGPVIHIPSMIFENDIPGISEWRPNQIKNIPESLTFRYDYDLGTEHTLIENLLSSSDYFEAGA